MELKKLHNRFTFQSRLPAPHPTVKNDDNWHENQSRTIKYNTTCCNISVKPAVFLDMTPYTLVKPLASSSTQKLEQPSSYQTLVITKLHGVNITSDCNLPWEPQKPQN